MGAVEESAVFRIMRDEGKVVLEEDIADLKESWKGPFGELI